MGFIGSEVAASLRQMGLEKECLRSISLQLHLFSEERDKREVSH
jgi:hypothetical protein